MNRGRSPLACAVPILVVGVIIAGCADRVPSGPWHSPPIIHTLKVELPQGWSSQGGTVTITSEVTCDEGVNEISARITRPDGSEDPTPVAMALTSGDTYSGTYAAPANTRTDGKAETYGVSVRAVSSADARSEMSLTEAFSVPAP